MADPQVHIGDSAQATIDDGDLEMLVANDGTDLAEVGKTGAVEERTAPEEEEKPAERTTFAEYLKSPMIELLIGSGTDQALLRAHKGLVIKSPFLANKLLGDSPPTRISLADDEVDAISCCLEWLYTGEYYPPKLPSGVLAADATAPQTDSDGRQLLKHARVYTLAEKLGLPTLKSLSHSKIHLVNSTALAELAYARYVYSHTSSEDLTIRKPVASFWGQRSHVLRHETEGSFRTMCLDYPEFAFDVLNFVLNAEEKRAQRRGEDDVGRSGRKRARA
ncbi:MAG: hypothetical protein LQ342_007645 [Letrouitia transgressa]|nr:MAG: hypothetical protein LQ342_007645 [Letrouitia transgressa]